MIMVIPGGLLAVLGAQLGGQGGVREEPHGDVCVVAMIEGRVDGATEGDWAVEVGHWAGICLLVVAV